MTTFERHYTVQELAELWGLSEETIRHIFRDEPGVLRLGVSCYRGPRGYVKGRITLRIPASVAAAVHQRRSRRDDDV